MERISRKTQALSTAERWKAQYDHTSTMPMHNGRSRKEIYEALAALEDPTPEQVNEIIGNSTWTSIICEWCDQKVEEAVFHVGDYEDATICFPCLKAAVALEQPAEALVEEAPAVAPALRTLTVAVIEETTPLPPAYPDPLLYYVKVSPDADEDEILQAVAEHRWDDLGLDPEEDSDDCYDVKSGLKLLFAFEGELMTSHDWRT